MTGSDKLDPNGEASTARVTEPVFIMSPTTRSGTNLVYHLLVSAGLCQKAAAKVLTAEDWFVAPSHHLIEYANKLQSWWELVGFGDHNHFEDLKKQLLKNFGEALLSLGKMDGELPMLLKTPSSQNIQNFRRLFPDARLILLIRDGRDTCQSALRSDHGATYSELFGVWADRVDQIIDFAGKPFSTGADKRIVWIRYEDVVHDPVAAARELAQYMGAEIPFDNEEWLRNLPVFGSSELGRSPEDKFDQSRMQVHSKPNDFKPIGRWKSWPVEVRNEFKQIANKQLVALGYENSTDW